MGRKTVLILLSAALTAGMAAPAQAETYLTRAAYTPADSKDLQRVWRTYGSIPGGIALEGPAAGFPDVRQTAYDSSQNMFILNDGTRYRVPVSRGELRELAEAIKKEDVLGFSFQRDGKVYGALAPKGTVAETLKLADADLARKIFGPSPAPGQGKGTSVFFRFQNYRFAETGGYLKPEGAEIKISLIPVLRRTDEKGNYLPDFETLKSGNVPPGYRARAQEMVRYLKDDPEDLKFVRKIVRYGEVAAFLRTLKSQRTNLDDLLSSIQSSREVAASA